MDKLRAGAEFIRQVTGQFDFEPRFAVPCFLNDERSAAAGIATPVERIAGHFDRTAPPDSQEDDEPDEAGADSGPPPVPPSLGFRMIGFRNRSRRTRDLFSHQRDPKGMLQMY